MTPTRPAGPLAPAPPPAAVPAAPSSPPPPLPERLDTSRGPIHLYRPAGFRPEHAGVVIYLHGYGPAVDRVWEEHALARQFAASGVNALFVVPAAPTEGAAPVVWDSPGALLEAVRARAEVPAGPLVVVGHSGAYRTIVPWLRAARREVTGAAGAGRVIDEVVLLDGLFGVGDELLAWTGTARAGQARLTLVGGRTSAACVRLVRAVDGALTVHRFPAHRRDLTARQRTARVVYFPSPYEHMEIVTGGQVIPVLLGRTRLTAL